MSAINEAYARIDYATIQRLQNELDDLKRQMPTGTFSVVRGDSLPIKKTKVFARAVPVGENDKNPFTVQFGSGMFSSNPVVTVTMYDPTANKSDTSGTTIIMRNLTKKSVDVEVTRKGKGRFVLHVIAIGETD